MCNIHRYVDWIRSVDWTPEAITAAGTVAFAFLTLVLAIGTLFLWFATRRLVRGTEKTAERQLRAYVFVDHTTVANFNTSQPFAELIFKNSGQTPAYNVRVLMTGGIASFPLTKEPVALPNDIIAPSCGHLGPRGTFHSKQEDTMTDVERTDIQAGRAAFYVRGKLFYKDTFGREQVTNFFFHYIGNNGQMHPGGAMAPCAYGNDAT